MFEVYRSSFKYWLKKPKKITAEIVELHSKIREMFSLSNGSAGSRTISSMVTNSGIDLSRYRARKAMLHLGLISRQPSAPKYKKANNEHLAVPNLLNRQFDVIAPNEVWRGDVTYIWIGNRWAYLAVVLDLYSRNPVGWAMSLSPNSQLTSKALLQAYELLEKPKDVMFHSDQGMHYTSKKFRQTLWQCQIKQSMSRRGNCWDNAPLERFFRSIITEWMPKFGYTSLSEAEHSISNYIAGYYSLLRPHQHNNGKTPNETEKLFFKAS